MNLIIGILIEITFLEILILILISAFSKRPKKKKENEFVMKIKESVEPKRSLKKINPQKTKKQKILKRETGEFERFLLLLIPIVVVAYLLVSNYVGVSINIWTIILLVIGILVISILIFLEATKKYRG